MGCPEPGTARYVETLDFKLAVAGHIDGLLKDAKTGEPGRPQHGHSREP